MSTTGENNLESVPGSSDLDSPFVCKPLDDMAAILKFLEEPPPWRSLCKELVPHSKSLVRNVTVNREREAHFMEAPQRFCHYSPQDREPERRDESQLPKTLVCHDMANGYHDDSIIDGTVNYDAYHFYNWAGIDIFCYFSHHLITIPPVSWINVAHAHGVKVIGTVITEWAEGVKFWDNVLASEKAYKKFASALVTIANTLKFDGWLLNVENKISDPEMLLSFVEYLHELMHREMPHATLVWYDSVTVKGHLNWQNGLNEQNKAFFDVTDYFFTNYSWSVKDIEASAKMAGSRAHDVLIGLDVWGRNFYGGGQFNTMEAVKLVYSLGCSMAIFAPAWTHEALSFETNSINAVYLSKGLDMFQQFILRDRALWGSIWPFLNTRVPNFLPFKTSFCRGLGKKRRLYGEVVCPVAWYNLRHQHYQPNSAHGPHGYILSSLDNILKMLHHAQFVDKGGIIKYRTEFKNVRQEVLSSKPSLKTLNFSEIFSNYLDETETSEAKEAQLTKKALAREAVEVMAREVREVQAQQDNAIGMDNTDNVTLDNKESEVLINTTTSAEPASSAGSSMAPKPSTSPGPPNSYDDGHLRKNNKRKMTTVIKDFLCCKNAKLEKSGKIEEKRKQKRDNLTKEINDKTEIEMVQGKSNEQKLLESQDATIKTESKIDKVEELPKESTDDVQEIDSEGEDNTDYEKPALILEPSIRINLGKTDTKSRWGLAAIEQEKECLELYLEDSFIGGSCLRINPSDSMLREHRYTRLFFCDFECEDSLVFCVVTKNLPEFRNQSLNIILHVKSNTNKDQQIVLVGEDLKADVPILGDMARLAEITFVRHLEPDRKPFCSLRKYMLLHEPEFYVPVDNPYGWIVRYYSVHLPGARVMSVNCHTEHAVGGILLGHFSVCHRDRKKDIA